jgi:hypothetical protein
MAHCRQQGGALAADEAMAEIQKPIWASEDLKIGLASFRENGPGHAKFNAGGNVKSPLIETSGKLFFKAWELAFAAANAAKPEPPRTLAVAPVNRDSEAIHRRLSAATGAMPDLAPDSLIQTSSVAEAYWALHNQSRDGWTHELDIRPYSERW